MTEMEKRDTTTRKSDMGSDPVFTCRRFDRFMRQCGADESSVIDGKKREDIERNIRELRRMAAEGDCVFCFRCKRAKRSCKSAIVHPMKGYRDFFVKEPTTDWKREGAIMTPRNVMGYVGYE